MGVSDPLLTVNPKRVDRRAEDVAPSDPGKFRGSVHPPKAFIRGPGRGGKKVPFCAESAQSSVDAALSEPARKAFLTVEDITNIVGPG